MTVTGVRVTLVRLPGRSPDALATELMESMLRNGSIVARQGRLHAAAEHTPRARFARRAIPAHLARTG